MELRAFLTSSRPDIAYLDWTDPSERGDLLMVPRSFLEETCKLLDSRVSEADLIAQAEAMPPPESDGK